MDDGADVEPESRAHFVDILAQQRFAYCRLACIVQAAAYRNKQASASGSCQGEKGAKRARLMKRWTDSISTRTWRSFSRALRIIVNKPISCSADLSGVGVTSKRELKGEGGGADPSEGLARDVCDTMHAGEGEQCKAASCYNVVRGTVSNGAKGLQEEGGQSKVFGDCNLCARCPLLVCLLPILPSMMSGASSEPFEDGGKRGHIQVGGSSGPRSGEDL